MFLNGKNSSGSKPRECKTVGTNKILHSQNYDKQRRDKWRLETRVRGKLAKLLGAKIARTKMQLKYEEKKGVPRKGGGGGIV